MRYPAGSGNHSEPVLYGGPARADVQEVRYADAGSVLSVSVRTVCRAPAVAALPFL